MASYRLTKDAQQDLMQWGSIQSKLYLSELQHTISLLSEASEKGITRPDISVNTYSFPHAHHVIYYVLHNDHVLVFAVLHKSMVPNTHLEGRSVNI